VTVRHSAIVLRSVIVPSLTVTPAEAGVQAA